MQRNEIIILVGVLVLIVGFAWWMPGVDTKSDVDSVSDAVVDVKQEKVDTPVTKSPSTKSPNAQSSSTNLPGSGKGSVNPAANTGQPVPVFVTSKNLSGSVFRLTTYNGVPLPTDSKFTLTFRDDSLSFKICNTLGSSYYIDGNIIKAGNVVSTTMYCTTPASIMSIESDAASLLGSGTALIYRSGSTLILSQAKTGVVLVFEGF